MSLTFGDVPLVQANGVAASARRLGATVRPADLYRLPWPCSADGRQNRAVVLRSAADITAPQLDCAVIAHRLLPLNRMVACLDDVQIREVGRAELHMDDLRATDDCIQVDVVQQDIRYREGSTLSGEPL